MSSEPTTTSVSISDPHQIRPVFVNSVIGQGHLNGVVNLTFGTFQFTPTMDGKIDPDMVVSSRLRMDMTCAKQLHAALTAIFDQLIKPQNGTSH